MIERWTERGGEGAREREKDRERKRGRKREKQRERWRKRERERYREGERKREGERERDHISYFNGGNKKKKTFKKLLNLSNEGGHIVFSSRTHCVCVCVSV